MDVSKAEELKTNATGAIEPQLGPEAEQEEERLRRRLQAIEALKAMRFPFPPDFKFDRDEANAR